MTKVNREVIRNNNVFSLRTFHEHSENKVRLAVFCLLYDICCEVCQAGNFRAFKAIRGKSEADYNLWQGKLVWMRGIVSFFQSRDFPTRNYAEKLMPDSFMDY